MTGITFVIVYLLFSIVNFLGILDNACARTIVQLLVVIIISCVYLRQAWNWETRWAHILAYCVRLALCLFSVYGRSIAYLPFDGEDTEYFYSAVFENVEHAMYGKDALITVTAWLSIFLGDSRLLYQYINLMLSVAGIWAADHIMSKLEIGPVIRTNSLIIAAIFPSFSMFNIIYSREALVSAGTVISVLAFLKYLSENTYLKKAFYLFIAFVIIIFICLFHAAPVVIAFGYLMAILFYDCKRRKMGLSIESFGFFMLIALPLASVFVIFPNAFDKLRGITDVKSIAAKFMFESNLAAGSSYAQYVGDSDTWGRFIMYTPARMFYAMFAPLPWEWRGLADVATFFMNSLFYIVVSTVSIIDSLRKNYWNLFNKWLVMVLIFASAMIGWGCVAFGTSIRHRDKFFLLFIILFALELRGKDKQVCSGDMRTDEAEADI